MSHQFRAPTLVTLVHGTFDTSARWTEPDSLICRTINGALDDSAVISAFKWSGKNDQHQRALSAKQLADKIAENHSFFPGCKQIIIGHSHGGNIIKSAIDQMSENLTDSIIGIVTVSTPFIKISQRNFITEFVSLFFILRFMIIILSSIAWFKNFVLNYESIMNSISFVFVPFRNSELLPIVGMAFIVLIVITPIHIVRLFTEKLVFILNSIISRNITLCHNSYRSTFDIVNKDNIPYFCIITKTDEVNFLFGAGMIVNLASRISGSLLYFMKLTHESYIKPLLRESKYALLILSSVPITILFAGESSGHNITILAADVFLYPLAVVFLSINIIFLLIVIVGIFVFGLTGYLDFFGLDLSYSMLPNYSAAARVHVVKSKLFKNYFRGNNTHTSILYDEEVSNCIKLHLQSLRKF